MVTRGKDWEDENPGQHHPNTIKAWEEAKAAGVDLAAHPLIEGNIVRSCPVCLAPGRYSSAIEIRDGYSAEQINQTVTEHPNMNNPHTKGLLARGWVECWVPRGDIRVGKPIGDVCPSCGSYRPEAEYHVLSNLKVE